MLHIPLLRGGKPYRSLELQTLKHVRTGEPVAQVSHANAGVIARDLLAAGEARKALQDVPAAEMLAICRKAAELFATAELPVEPGGALQGPEDYVRQLSSTSGLPQSLCRFNMEKVRGALDSMEDILSGLTRGLDLAALDSGWVWQEGRRLSYVGQTDTLGAILPSNSPGVHTLWLPSYALKVPVVLKPGREEPWTPFRVAQALIAAGMPPQAAFYYPTDHGGAAEILLRTGRSMLFGDANTVRPWKDDPRVQLHGPGWSKVIFGADQYSQWERHVDLAVTSIAENGGRSCLNSSGVWMPADGQGTARKIAEAIAERMAAIPALPLDHPEARLAAFTRPEVARRISEMIDRQLRIPGAVDLTREIRGTDRVAEVDGCTFLLPTLIWCEPDHPMAGMELLFPFATAVEAPGNELLSRIGSTLVATAITEDRAFERALMDCPSIDHLNLGPIPTSRISRDQPHEGNLFDHLYRRRALQTGAWAA